MPPTSAGMPPPIPPMLPKPPPPIMPPMPPPPSIMRLIIGPMVCIIMAKRRLPIFAFIISSIGAIWVIMSSPPPPLPKPANWAFAGIVVSVNSSSSAAAWHTTLSAPVMAKLLVRRAARRSGAVRTHGARLEAGEGAFCEKDHTRLWTAAGADDGIAVRAVKCSGCVAPQRLLHCRRAEIHLHVHVGRNRVRQHVGDPHQAAAVIAFGEHLRRRAVVCQTLALDGIDLPPLLVVAIDQHLARHRAVGKRHDARVTVEPGVSDEAGHQPRMQRAEVAQRVPDVRRVRVDDDVFLDGSHWVFP